MAYPWFKFTPNDWDNGQIQLCSFEAQGIFINICSMYWSRNGDLTHQFAAMKICRGDSTVIDELIDKKVINVTDGDISIGFLDEQLKVVEELSYRNSLNARKRWDKSKESDMQSNNGRNAVAMRSQSDGNAEKRRQDKNREEDNTEPRKKAPRFTPPSVRAVSDFLNGLKYSRTISDQEAQKFVDHYTSNGWKVGGKASMKDWRASARGWMSRGGFNNSKTEEIYGY